MLKPSQYKHIIWDWNGTLVDDAWLCVDIMDGMLKARSMQQLSMDRYQRLFDFPVIDYYRRLGFDFEKEPFTVSGSEFIANYNARFHEPELHLGVVQLLDYVESTGLTQSILSAGKQEYVNDWITHHHLKKYFIKILGIDNHYASGKTDIGKNWVLEMEYSPEEVLMVGDTIHDLEVANAMGIKCVLIAQGHTNYSRLQKTGAPVFNDLFEFKKYLQALLPVNRSVST